MLEITNITPQFAIAPQISDGDFEQILKLGFRSILNARPDDETGDFMSSNDAKRMASAHGLGYVHIPTANHAVFESDIIDAFENALVAVPSPVLAHCKSGTRAAILWAMVAARHRPVANVISTLNDAGQNLAFLEQELLDQAKDVRGSPLRLKNDGLLSLGRSPLLGKRTERP